MLAKPLEVIEIDWDGPYPLGGDVSSPRRRRLRDLSVVRHALTECLEGRPSTATPGDAVVFQHRRWLIRTGSIAAGRGASTAISSGSLFFELFTRVLTSMTRISSA